MLGTTLAGIAVLAIVVSPDLYNQGMKLIPVAAIAGFVVAIPLSFMVSKRLT
jgi:putative flippase GtrA